MKYNIYQDVESGQFYYGMGKMNKPDKIAEEDVSVGYAFDYCAKKNFGAKGGAIAKKGIYTASPQSEAKLKAYKEFNQHLCGK